MKTIARAILLAGVGIEFAIRQSMDSSYVMSNGQCFRCLVIFIGFSYNMYRE